MISVSRAKSFFAFARERHSVYLNRQAGFPRPWTEDPILDQHRFTNVFRELDKTTQWFRRHVRLPWDGKPEVLLATVVFRLFNRIETGEAIFCQPTLFGGKTAFEMYLANQKTSTLKGAIKQHCGEGPYVTGAYMVRSKDGLPKLDGMLWAIDKFRKGNWRSVAENLVAGKNRPMCRDCADADGIECMNGHGLCDRTLYTTWQWLSGFDCVGPFIAYELVTDLRHTYLLNRAPDIMTWANPGPGARRGVLRLIGARGDDLQYRSRRGRLKIRKADNDTCMEAMRALLLMSQHEPYWPQRDKEKWPAWEMRDVEHTLCEFDKYERIRLGQGKTKGRYP